MTESQPAVIMVNGSARPLILESITDLVEELTGRRIGHDGRATDGKRLGIAVARNTDIVPRGQWATTALMPGDDIEIITAVQGG